MIIYEKGLAVEKINKAYDLDGKSGVSLKLRILVGTDIFNCKTTQAVLDLAEEGKEYPMTIQVRTRKEDPIFEVLSLTKLKP